MVTICKRPLFVFLTHLALLLPLLGYGQDLPGRLTHTDRNTSPHEKHLQFLLDAAVREGLPSVSLRVEGPGIDFQGAAGVADLLTGEPLTTNHAIYAASLGKTFTATVALQLCEEGRLGLDAPISTWLPAEVTKRILSSEGITLRHLLSHTSGLIDYMNDEKAWGSEFIKDPRRHWLHSDILPYLYDKPLLFEPGNDFHYSNSNYILVGLIIEQAIGQPLHGLIRKRILAPLGLQRTFNGHEAVRSEKHTHGYFKRRGPVVDTYPWYSHYGLADSGILSTPGELALFLRTLFTTEGLLSKNMQAEMLSVSGLGHPPSPYGMGIIVEWNPCDPGYQADMMYFPELDLTVVLAANASLGKANSIYERLLDAVVEITQDVVM